MTVGTILLLGMIVLVFLGMPVAFAIGIASAAAIVAGHYSLIILPQKIFAGIDSFPMLAIPFFVLAGNLMTGGGITDRIPRLHPRHRRLDARQPRHRHGVRLGDLRGDLRVRHRHGHGDRRHHHSGDEERPLPGGTRRRDRREFLHARAADPAEHHPHRLRQFGAGLDPRPFPRRGSARPAAGGRVPYPHLPDRAAPRPARRQEARTRRR